MSELVPISHCICAKSHKNQHTLISVIFLRLFSLSRRKNSPVASSLSICAEKYLTYEPELKNELFIIFLNTWLLL